MSIDISIRQPLSVIDSRGYSIKEAFSWILNYYDPNKSNEIISKILDSTCGKMLMWNIRDLVHFEVITNDICKDVKAYYHYDCSELGNIFKKKDYDIIIYDPPYIDLVNRNDTKKYENAFKYELTKTIDDLIELTTKSSNSFSKLLKDDGILIVKITDFHYKQKNMERLGGCFEMSMCFKDFYLFDDIIYRFFKNIPNLNFYNKKCAITHSHFLIFKKYK